MAKSVALCDAFKAATNLPAVKPLSNEVTLNQFGDAEIMGKIIQDFDTAMTASLKMVYAVLVLLFASFLQPITILFSLPLFIGRAVFAITQNAIILFDFANEQIGQDIDRTNNNL